MSNWEQVAGQLNSQTNVFWLEEYNGKLYGGTGSGGRLFEWNDVNAWVEKAGQLNSQTTINSLKTYLTKLMGSTGAAARLFRWDDVSAWAQVAGTLLSNDSNVYSLMVFSVDGKLYGGQHRPTGVPNHGGSLYRWNDVNAWVQVALPPENYLQRMNFLVELGGYIYGGAGNYYAGSAVGGGLFRSSGGAWTKVANGPGTSTGDRVTGMAVYNGKVYAIMSGTRGGRLYEFDGVSAWVEKAPAYSSYISGQALLVYKGRLYGASSGALLRWNDTNAWELVASPGNNLNYLAIYKGQIFAGTQSTGALYVWRGTCDTGAATDLAPESVTGNGTVLDEDDLPYIDEYGFDYGIYGAGYTDELTVAGAPATTAFSLSITGLDGAVWYYYRAKYHDTRYGWVYGGGTMFQAAHDSTWLSHEYQTTDSGSYGSQMQGNNWAGFTITALLSQFVKSVKVKLVQNFSGIYTGTFTISMRAVDGAGKPTGADLWSQTIPTSLIGAAADFEFGLGSAEFMLAAGEKRAFVCRISGGDATHNIGLRYGSNTYPRGALVTSSDGGVNWSVSGSDAYFYVYSTSGVLTYPATNIRPTTAIANGSILDATNVDQIGFEWGIATGVYTGSVLETTPPYSPGDISLPMTGLSPATPYFYRAKIHDTVLGWLYGNEVTFTTLQPLPEVRTDPPSDVTLTTIDAVGNILDVGAVSCDERGFVYGLASVFDDPGNVAPEDSGYDGVEMEEGTFGTGSFTLQLRNLNSGKPYYIRAYAHNSYGWSYGEEVWINASDTTNILLPNSDASIGIRFDSSPGGGYPRVGGGTIPHYALVRQKDCSFQFSYGYWGKLSGKYFVYEHHYYNSNMYTDIYGLTNPIRRTEGVVKIKWKARLFKNEYPYGEYQSHLITHATQYDGVQAYIPTETDGYDVCEIHYTNPFTGLAWTIAELDALQAGCSIGNGASYGTPLLDYMAVVVCWANAAVETRPINDFTGVGASLRGYVTEDEGEPCQVRFNWGLTTAYGTNTAWQTKSRNSEFSAAIAGLDPDQQYHFRAEILTPCGETFYSDDALVEGEFGSLILEQAYSIGGIRQSIFTESPTWTDITEYLMKLRTKRGRLHPLDRVEAGSLIVTLDNKSGNFWRGNAAGDYYPDIQPLTLTRLRYLYKGTFYNLWYGVSEAYHPGWAVDEEGGFTPIIQLECVDLFKSFARFSLVDNTSKLTEAEPVGSSHVVLEDVSNLHVGQSLKIVEGETSEVKIIQVVSESIKTVIFTTVLAHAYSANATVKKFPAVLSGQRIKDCALELGWPIALMDIDDGQCYVAEFTPANGGTNIMEHMNSVAESEDGIIFMAGDGHLTFQDSASRTKSPLNTSQATFSDDGVNNKYVHPELADDDTFIYNEADILGPAIQQQQVIIGDAQSEQGPRALVRRESQLLLNSDAFVQAFCLASRYATSALRCDSLLIKPKADPENLLPLVLGFELSTRITFKLNSATNPASVDKEYHIEGIEHEYDCFTDEWRTKWQLWSINRYRAYNCQHDGYFRNYSDGGSYDDMHDEASADYAENDGSSHNPYTDPDEIVVGQQLYYSFLGFNGSLWRGFMEFDTTGLLTADNVVAATIIVHIKESFIDDRPWNLVAVDPQTLVNPLVASDYGVLLTSTAQKGAATMIRAGYWLMLPLNANGLALIVKEGVSRFALRSNWDIAKSNNGGASGYTNEYAKLDNINTAYPPRLLIQLAE